MHKKIIYLLAPVVIILAAYGLIIDNYKVLPFMMFFLSLLMLVMGLEDFIIK